MNCILSNFGAYFEDQFSLLSDKVWQNYYDNLQIDVCMYINNLNKHK